ncbi:hypothetical protein BSKO_13095 [Bryopsis sp. KO-2023]|nr:hypothetical protein BSKO_13095 [Bryopsis sp. KO-2023]
MSTTRSGLILPRQRAPAFSTKGVFQGSIESFSSDQYEGKWLVLFFYPFDYTFVCPTELVAFSSAAKRFEELGAQVVAVSCDSVHVHFSWMSVPQAEGGVGMLNFPLLADNTKRMSRDYGVLVEDADDELCGASLRALFIIDPKFVVRSVVVNDEAVGRSVEETIRLIQAFQYADEHGETCPANWKPGDDTIAPDHKRSKSFFSKWSKKN